MDGTTLGGALDTSHHHTREESHWYQTTGEFEVTGLDILLLFQMKSLTNTPNYFYTHCPGIVSCFTLIII